MLDYRATTCDVHVVHSTITTSTIVVYISSSAVKQCYCISIHVQCTQRMYMFFFCCADVVMCCLLSCKLCCTHKINIMLYHNMGCSTQLTSGYRYPIIMVCTTSSAIFSRPPVACLCMHKVELCQLVVELSALRHHEMHASILTHRYIHPHIALKLLTPLFCSPLLVIHWLVQ